MYMYTNMYHKHNNISHPHLHPLQHHTTKFPLPYTKKINRHAPSSPSSPPLSKEKRHSSSSSTSSSSKIKIIQFIFSDVTKNDAHKVGGKGANLGECLRASKRTQDFVSQQMHQNQ